MEICWCRTWLIDVAECLWRGEHRRDTRMPTLSFSSWTMRSSPQVAFSEAISRINCRRCLGKRGLPIGLDFQRQNSRKSFAVPPNERIRLHVHQRIAPREHSAQGRHNPPRGVIGASRPDLSLLEQRQLFPEEEILRGQCAVANAPRG